jgi:hypothetical protein
VKSIQCSITISKLLHPPLRHQPLLLLAVIDLIAQGIIKTNFIVFTPDLGELFTL